MAKAKFSELMREYVDEAQKADEARRLKKKAKPVEGQPFWPHEFIRNTIIVCIFTGALILLSAFMPYYLEAPADPAGQPQVILPDWYLLWSYGLLKIADDVTVLGCPQYVPFIAEDGALDFSLPSVDFGAECWITQTTWAPLNAKMNGLLILNVLAVLPLILVPILDRGKSRRPVESPFWAAAGLAGAVWIFMVSVYSVNTVIYGRAPIYGEEYTMETFFTWLHGFGIAQGMSDMKDVITFFQLDLLSWLTNLLPFLVFVFTYIPLRMVQKAHGYEAKLNYNYYKVR
ncbi:MAG TPA: hypothetical protein VNZ52_00410 [Candidatus Thermoplasmatota archaeon]|nr:hypothetical protein [Candidatus Thermoplasmatota archaeon]